MNFEEYQQQVATAIGEGVNKHLLILSLRKFVNDFSDNYTVVHLSNHIPVTEENERKRVPDEPTDGTWETYFGSDILWHLAAILELSGGSLADSAYQSLAQPEETT